jgi:hypothetical protein
MIRHAWTGMHELACMLMQQLLLLSACVRVWLPPELALLTAPNIREYFYTKIRFSTPALSALLGLAGKICLS